MTPGLLLRVFKGAATAFALAVFARFLLGGYGGALGFMIFYAFLLGPAPTAFPTLASLVYLLWAALKRHFAEAVGAGLAVTMGIGLPLLLLHTGGPKAAESRTTLIPKDTVLVFGDDLQCYGSTACGSAIVLAGYRVAATNDFPGVSKAPQQGDDVYLTSLDDNASCQEKLKDYSTDFALPQECRFSRQEALDSNFVFLQRTIDPQNDAEIFHAYQNDKIIASSSRTIVQRQTLSPYFLLGELSRTVGIQNKQAFISALTGVALLD